jgi:hypothetical protein
LLTSVKRAANFKVYISNIKEEKEDNGQKLTAKKKKTGNGNVTVLPTITVLNGRIGGAPHFLSSLMAISLTAV